MGLISMKIGGQCLFTGFLQQTGQQSGAPGDDKPPGTEDSVDARTASYNAYMQYAYQQWMASQTGQSQSGSGWVNLSLIHGTPAALEIPSQHTNNFLGNFYNHLLPQR